MRLVIVSLRIALCDQAVALAKVSDGRADALASGREDEASRISASADVFIGSLDARVQSLCMPRSIPVLPSNGCDSTLGKVIRSWGRPTGQDAGCDETIAEREKKRVIAGFGRGDRIRTCDLLLPKQALYQAELRPD